MRKVNCLLYNVRKIFFIFTGMCATMFLTFNSEPQAISEHFQFQSKKNIVPCFDKTNAIRITCITFDDRSINQCSYI